MAQYHCHFQILKRGEGRSAVAGASYRAGEKITNEYDGVTHDYSNRNTVNSAAYRSGATLTTEQGNTFDYSGRSEIVHSEIMLPENAPQEFKNRATLWNAIEKKDKRHDAQLAREADISLPIEMSTEQHIEAIKEYLDENFVSKGIIADFNIHDDGSGNPHFHVMLTMRYVDENGFGKRRAEEQGNGYFQAKKRLIEWRKSWADVANKHLERNGFSERIDHRTLEAQGIDREPQKYRGRNYSNIEARKTAKERQGAREQLKPQDRKPSIRENLKGIEAIRQRVEERKKSEQSRGNIKLTAREILERNREREIEYER